MGCVRKRAAAKAVAQMALAPLVLDDGSINEVVGGDDVVA